MMEYIYLLLMPVTYGFTGWVTNWLALKMTFYPLEFKGLWKPYLGWQGIIPRKAYKMAGKYVDVITERLITLEEIMNRVNPDDLAKELQEPIENAIDHLVQEAGSELYPQLWKMLPEGVRQSIIDDARKQGPAAVRGAFEDIRERINDLFDIKGFVLRNLTGANTSLLVEMFQRVGKPEFKFIERSGFYFGSGLGMIQIAAWLLYPEWWTLPIQGVIVGYATNWMALRMIFRPLREKKFGPLRYQGLFLKRQNEVSAEFSKLVAQEILTPPKIINEVLHGQAADALLEIIQKHVKESFDRVTGMSKPILVLSVGNKKYEEIKNHILESLQGELLNASGRVGEFLQANMDLAAIMTERMQMLTPEEYENVLRSAFQEDEILLIMIGAALGAIIGTLQAVLMLFG